MSDTEPIRLYIGGQGFREDPRLYRTLMPTCAKCQKSIQRETVLDGKLWYHAHCFDGAEEGP